MNVKELKILLKARGLCTTGLNGELATRLVLFIQESEQDES